MMNTLTIEKIAKIVQRMVKVSLLLHHREEVKETRGLDQEIDLLVGLIQVKGDASEADLQEIVNITIATGGLTEKTTQETDIIVEEMTTGRRGIPKRGTENIEIEVIEMIGVIEIIGREGRRRLMSQRWEDRLAKKEGR
jgi:hypothetical protein